MKTAIERLADILDMDPDHIREAAEVMKEQRECAHDWELTWPNDPEEWTCKLCGKKGTR